MSAVLFCLLTKCRRMGNEARLLSALLSILKAGETTGCTHLWDARLTFYERILPF